MKNRILASRKSCVTNPSETELCKFYFGEEAEKLGIIDGVGRVY